MARLRYMGGGFIPKIPARDLTADEVKRFGLDRLLASGLYEDLYPPKKNKVVYEEEVKVLSNELDEIEETFSEED